MPWNSSSLPFISAKGVDSSTADEPIRTRWAAYAYTAFISVIVFVLHYFLPFSDFMTTIWQIAFFAVLVILLIAILISAILGRRPGECALTILNLLNALIFAFYCYLVTLHYWAVVFPDMIQILAFLVAFGCGLGIFLGYVLFVR